MTEKLDWGAAFAKNAASLRVLIPSLIVLFVSLLLAYVLTQESLHETESIYSEYKHSQMETAIRLQSSFERYMRLGLPNQVRQEFSALSVRPEIRVALLTDENGKIIAATRMALLGMDLEQVVGQYSASVWPKHFQSEATDEMAIRQSVLTEHNAILLTAPVRLDDLYDRAVQPKIGKLCIYHDLTFALGEVTAGHALGKRQLLLGSISIALLIGLLLHWKVTRRVVMLLKGAQRVGGGDLITGVGVSGNDEIGRLGTEFDNMLKKLSTSSIQLRKLFLAVEQSQNSIIITDVQGAVEYVNQHFKTISGYTDDEVLGRKLHLCQPPRSVSEVYEEVWGTIKSGQVWRGELLSKNKSGKLYLEEVVVSPIFDESANITHFLSEQTDITERKLAEEKVRLFEKVFLNANEAIMISDESNNVLAVNPSFTKVSGYAAEEIIGKNPSMLSSGLMDAEIYQKMWASINADGKWQGEVMDRRKNGEIYSEWLSVSTLQDKEGKPTHYIALMTDISERRAIEERAAYLAQHDLLTGLPNRLLFLDRLQQAITYAERQKTNVALLFMDLDRFKNVNDTLGHRCGDLLLQEVTQRIRPIIRSSDTVSRLGGDEFIIMLPNLNDLTDIIEVVNKLIETIAAPYQLEEHSAHTTTSVGVSVYPQDGIDGETLIRNADTAMYQAKEAGRNCYRFFTQAMNRSISRRVDLENKLRNALGNQELRLHYQPVVNMRNGQIVSAEALVRWQHPVDGLVSPAEFISIAEETGMIVQLGNWVLHEACRQTQEWRKSGLREISIAVNLSSVQLLDPNLENIVYQALLASGLPTSALELEITESAMMKNPEQAAATLSKLSELGIRFSIDDFGTGYSSLSYLKKFPFDVLKIDQSFVRDLTIDNDDAAIVRAVIGIANSLGLSVIAEGVETAEQLYFLEGLNCEMMQGYYFSRPLPAGEFKALLESGRTLNRLTT